MVSSWQLDDDEIRERIAADDCTPEMAMRLTRVLEQRERVRRLNGKTSDDDGAEVVDIPRG